MRTKHIISLGAAFLLFFSLIALNFELKKVTAAKSLVKKVKVSNDSFKNGDIIFQTSVEGQGRAIQLATHSRYTHVAVLFEENGEWMVYEAVQPVRVIPLADFISNGDSAQYCIKRFSGSDTLFNSANLAIMKNYLHAQLGKPYDPFFNWDEEALYCSEYVRKAYEKVGVSLGEMKPLKSYDLKHPIVRSILRQRYGSVVPDDVEMVSPGSIFDDKRLMIVSDHYNQKPQASKKKTSK